MGKGNGKSEAANLDLEHELPPGEGGEETSAAAAPAEAAAGAASEVETLKAERDALLDRLARLQAEFDNARKRAVREQQEFRDYAAADVIKGLLPALDSFERALKASQNPPKQSLGGAPAPAPAPRLAPRLASAAEASEFRNGIELIYRQLQDALQKAGVQPIASVGQAFDPRVHEAIEMVDTSEVPDHHVLDELQRGYKFKDRLLRPAMVRVARNSGA